MARLRILMAIACLGSLGAGCLCIRIERVPPVQPKSDIAAEARSVVRELGVLAISAYEAHQPEQAILAATAATWIVPQLTIAGKMRWHREHFGYQPFGEKDPPPPTLREIDECVGALTLYDLNAQALDDRAQWPAVVQAIRTNRGLPKGIPEWPWVRDSRLRLQRVLAENSIDMDFTEATLYDLIDFIQEFAKINIMISVDVRRDEIPDRKVDFIASSEVLENTLRRLCDLYGLTWRIDGAILVIVRK